MNKIHSINKKTYNALAEQYDSRVAILTPVTITALKKFSPYLKKEAQILDIGCAVGSVIESFRSLGFENICGIDISEEMLNYSRKRNPKTDLYCGEFLTYEFDKKFDAIIAFAFIHLFPLNIAKEIIYKINDLLNQGGFVYIGTTESQDNKEGFEIKKDYTGEHKRYRKHWQKDELDTFLQECGFKIVNYYEHTDAIGKKWMDYIIQK